MNVNDNQDLGPNVVLLKDAKLARIEPTDALIKHGVQLEAEREDRANWHAMERKSKAREMAFYDDLQAIVERVGELADMAEYGAGEAAVDAVVQDIIARIDRLPPPREDRLRLDLGRAGLSQGGDAANDGEGDGPEN